MPRLHTVTRTTVSCKQLRLIYSNAFAKNKARCAGVSVRIISTTQWVHGTFCTQIWGVGVQEAFLFDWASLPPSQFAVKLLTVWFGFFMTMALPVSAVTFDPMREPVQCLVSASTGSMFIVTILVLRLYLGWQHVGSRLLSATVEYEETGWYDGQVGSPSGLNKFIHVVTDPNYSLPP